MKLILSVLLIALASVFPVKAAVVTGNPSLQLELKQASERGRDWLVKSQNPEGYWSMADVPAITALAVVALSDGTEEAQVTAHKKGLAYIRASAKPDGSFYRKEQWVNYNTALCLLALSTANDPADAPLIRKARGYLISSQIDLDEPGSADSVFDGGIGYGSKYQHSDLSNTLLALEALHHSRRHADSGEKTPELNFAAAIQFIQNCQQLPSHNKQKWVSDDPANRGGFVYYPGVSMAGETNLPSERTALRSYGSISYAGLLSYIYAGLKKDDPRITAVLEWLKQNYTLQENPGMGQQGLFYYFHTMSKALHIAGVDTLEVKGTNAKWREQLGLKMLNLQQQDGAWKNDTARWMESDPALVTAYGVLTLKFISLGL